MKEGSSRPTEEDAKSFDNRYARVCFIVVIYGEAKKPDIRNGDILVMRVVVIRRALSLLIESSNGKRKVKWRVEQTGKTAPQSNN